MRTFLFSLLAVALVGTAGCAPNPKPPRIMSASQCLDAVMDENIENDER